jgi:hypothetical protein
VPITAGGYPPIAERVVDELLDDPATATWAGDHRADDRLPDWSADAVRARVRRLREVAHALAQVDPEVLDPPDAVDLELLRAAVDARLFALTETRDHEWDPLVHNPGFLLHKLLVRPAPAADRLVPLIGRLEALPDALAVAEAVLTDCPTVHLETAVGQAAGAAALVREQVGGLAETEPGLRRRAEAACLTATAALERHETWLRARVERPGRDPRLGRALWEAKLGHTLDGELDAAELLSQAEARLDVVWQRLADATRVMGFRGPRAALDALAADAPDDATIVAAAGHALAETTAFVAEHDLVPMLDDPVEVVRMPEFARGIAVAYCDAPGPLEAAGVPTFYAISPTPADWSAERVASFYREYNHAQLRNLTVHEAMPGHYLQLAHERRFTGSSRARAVCTSGAFREGWAVYCEEMMADHGFGGPPLRLQQLKLQLRMTINTILDQLVHCAGLTEADGMALMTGRGLQEEGEAAGKWRRALLTSTQLSEYFAGYTEVAAIAAARPAGVSVRDWHGSMLAHGAPPPRHLRTLLGV